MSTHAAWAGWNPLQAAAFKAYVAYINARGGGITESVIPITTWQAYPGLQAMFQKQIPGEAWAVLGLGVAALAGGAYALYRAVR
jgi:hypothetical protein